MSEVSPTPGSTHCPSCGAAFTGPWCATCGERRLQPALLGLRHYAGEAWSSLTDTDSRLLRSVIALLRRPGALTRAWWIGQRQPFLGPIQVFVLASLLFFLISPFDLFSTPLRFHLHIDFLAHRDSARALVHERVAPELDRETFLRDVVPSPRAPDGSPVRASADDAGPQAAAIARYRNFEDDFDRRTSTLARSLVFVMIPLIAVLSWLLALPLQGPPAPTLHVVYATHFLAATQAISVLIGLLLPPVAVLWVAARFGVAALAYLDIAYSLLFFGLLAVYLVAASRRSLALGRVASLLHGVGLTLGLLWIWNGYRALLFFVVFHSLD
jgi:hypothetical protein